MDITPAEAATCTSWLKPNYIFWSGGGTTHGSPYDYDAHVPLIFMGAGVKPGRYDQRVRVNELAPTLGHLLGVPFKGDAKGRVLREAMEQYVASGVSRT